MKKFALPIFVIGTAMSAFHWIGVCVAGFGLSFYGRSIKTKLAFGAVGGLVVWLAFVMYLSSAGIYDKAAHTGTLFNLSIFFAVILGAVSGLASSFELEY